MSDSDSDSGGNFLLGFAFGNVDAKGKAELDYLDEVRGACMGMGMQGPRAMRAPGRHGWADRHACAPGSTVLGQLMPAGSSLHAWQAGGGGTAATITITCPWV